MSTDAQHATLDAFALSRIGATAALEGGQLVADWVSAPAADPATAPPRTPGLHLTAQWEGEPLSFWVPEPEWCAWLAPQLAAPALAQIDPEWLPLLSAWTLAPLDSWLQGLGRGALSQVTVTVGEPPAGGWRLTLSEGTCRLPMWVQQASPTTLHTLLAALTPSPQQTHELALGLGWCLLESDAWEQLSEGDALPILGMADTLDTLWVHPYASPGQIRLYDAQRAKIIDAPLPLADAPHGTLRLCVEVGLARLTAPALAAWVPGTPLDIDAHAHTLLRLTTPGRLWAQGHLLRLADGWTVRITTLAR